MRSFLFSDLNTVQEEEAHEENTCVGVKYIIFYFRKQQTFLFFFFFKQIILKKPLRVKINPSVNSFHSNSELSC